MSPNSSPPWFRGIFRDTWAFAAICALSGIVVIAFGVGFLILPRFQQGHHTSSTEGVVANALGFHHHENVITAAQPPLRIPTYVAWNESTIHEALSGDIKRGEFIAINCTACHGEKGMTAQTWIPNLAGVDPLVLYKQLADFRSGTRLSGPMSAIAQSLSPQQSSDVAAYFASLPGLPQTGGERMPEPGRSYREKNATRRLIFAGDPTRGIAGCATCHGPAGYRMGAPALSHQNQAYLEQQLQNFAQGVRTNDMHMPMRTIGRSLKAEEIHALAVAYSVGDLR
jgi:cytochrome c553